MDVAEVEMRVGMLWVALAVGCARSGPPVAAIDPVAALSEPEAGWYNGACYAALDLASFSQTTR